MKSTKTESSLTFPVSEFNFANKQNLVPEISALQLIKLVIDRTLDKHHVVLFFTLELKTRRHDVI